MAGPALPKAIQASFNILARFEQPETAWVG